MQKQSHITVHARPDDKIAPERKLTRKITPVQNRALKHAATRRRRRRDIVLEVPEALALEGKYGDNPEAELDAQEAYDQGKAIGEGDSDD